MFANYNSRDHSFPGVLLQLLFFLFTDVSHFNLLFSIFNNNCQNYGFIHFVVQTESEYYFLIILSFNVNDLG